MQWLAMKPDPPVTRIVLIAASLIRRRRAKDCRFHLSAKDRSYHSFYATNPKGANHDPTRKSALHGQDPHHGWPRAWCVAQLRRPLGHQAFDSRQLGQWHQSRATVRRGLVG